MTRKLRPEERALWDRVARSATPLDQRSNPADILSPPDHTPPDHTAETGGGLTFAPFAIGEKARTAPRALATGADAPTMDAKSYKRLKGGKLAPEARIDLHGMTLDQAHPELVGFITRSHMRGLRLVLVITGKGKTFEPHQVIPERRGILRRQVPQWLKMPPCGPLILDVAQAHRRHGGEGALYVYLRRRR